MSGEEGLLSVHSLPAAMTSSNRDLNVAVSKQLAELTQYFVLRLVISSYKASRVIELLVERVDLSKNVRSANMNPYSNTFVYRVVCCID